MGACAAPYTKAPVTPIVILMPDGLSETSPGFSLGSWPPVFRPHPNLSDEVNRHIAQSEIEGGVSLRELQPGTTLQIHTRNTCYMVLILHGTMALISGHPLYCPRPVLVRICGSTWGGSMLKLHFVGRGMHLEFRHPEYHTPIITSPIQEIREWMSPVTSPASFQEWLLQ